MSFYDDPRVSESEMRAFNASDVRTAVQWLRKYYPKLATENVQTLGQALVDYRAAVADNDLR